MKALVLSGGSILGAFQAGAIAKVLQDGFEPDLIVGISVGALNGGFLTSFIGEWRHAFKPKVNAATHETMWQTAGRELQAFWTNKVREPKDLLVPQSDLTLSVLFGTQFNGIYNPSPLYTLIDQTLKLEHMRHQETCKFLAGAVQMGTGEIKYVGQDSNEVISFIKASAALPVVLPMVKIGGEFYSDGGLRDIVPFQEAIRRGATEIKVIICQTLDLKRDHVETTTIGSFVSRALEVLTNEVALDDLHLEANQSHIKVDLIGPSTVLGAAIDSFQAANIKEFLEMGAAQAAQPKRVSLTGVVDA
jgi:NTE family protein